MVVAAAVVGMNPNKDDESLIHKTVYQSPNSIDGILSKDFLRLSLGDRNKLDEEVHGVSTLAPQETPEMLAAGLRDLSQALHTIPAHDKVAYTESQVFPDTYVNSPEFRLRFLRCELFDASKAALRMVKFLKFASHLFGPQLLQRPMRLSDFTKDEKKRLGLGIVQIFPYRDRSGRPIYGVVDFRLGNYVTRYKIALYLQYCLSDDVESQRKGLIQLFWVRSADQPLELSTMDEWEYIVGLHESTPIRTCATHWCLPPVPLWHPIHAIRCGHTLSLGRERSRVKFHTGEKTELLYVLKTYGIPVEFLPVTDTGNLKTSYLKQWMRARNHLEATRAAAEATGSLCKETTVVIPASTDVVFRCGTSLQCHPGNARLEGLLEGQLREHVAAGIIAPKDRSAIAQAVLQHVLHEQKGRFLQWDKRGWWTVLEDPTDIWSKVDTKVRRYGDRLLTLRTPQTIKSQTSAFLNNGSDQGQRGKRRRLAAMGVDGGSSSGDESGSETCELTSCFKDFVW